MVNSSDILKAKLLIVDDKAANVQLLEGMLRVAGSTRLSPQVELDTSLNLRFSAVLFSAANR
jgi:hypothetical protein